MKNLCLIPFLLVSFFAFTMRAGSENNSTVAIPPYLHLKGMIDGKYAITMDITTKAREESYHVKATYYYDMYKSPIELDGNYMSSSNIKLDALADLDHSERFEGIFDGSTFSGVWSKLTTKDNKQLEKLLFKLSIDTTEGIPLSSFCFHDSLCGMKKGKDCVATASIYFEFLLPDQKKQMELNNGLCKIYLESDSIAELRIKMKSKAAEYLKSYQKDMSAMMINTDGKLMSVLERDSLFKYGCMGCNVHQSYWSVVKYNTGGVFSVDLLTDDYGGGMGHCCLDENYCTYSIAEMRIVDLNDIVSKKDSMIIKKILAKRLTSWGFGGFTGSEIAKLSIPENYYFTQKGINFIFKGLIAYWEYIPVFIPFSEFGDKLRKHSWMQ